MKHARRLSLLAAAVSVAMSGCSSCGAGSPTTSSEGGGGSAGAAADGGVTADAIPKTPANALTLTIVYGSEKKSWFEEEAKRYVATSPKSSSGKPVRIDLKAMGSGEGLKAIVDGTVKAHVFSPASGVYVTLLNDAWLGVAGRTKAIAPAGEPLVLSPVVIAMWKPMAEALGFPKKNLSWNDILKISTHPKGWGSVGFAEWGKFKLGHTHPEFSNSGLLAVLATAYAGAKKTRDLTVADLDAKPTREFLTNVEESIVHYGKSTGFFSDKMVSRGPSYLSAAVLYENLVIESYAKSPTMPIVAIYPTEGTFWSDHPYSILAADWVGAEEKAAAEGFFTYLRERPSQERALALGFRPSDTKIAVGAPIDAAHGVDPKQPQTVLPVPDAKVVQRIVPLWHEIKKGTDIVFVFDKSGSMAGKPLEEAKQGAKSFLSTLTEKDDVTLMFFDSTVHPPVGPLRLKDGRTQLLSRIDGVVAGGGTALYDAIAAAYDVAKARAVAEPKRIHAVVVMTDGKDENSTLRLEPLKAKFPGDESVVKVFTIAYGTQAESKILDGIAESAKGSAAKGSVDTIRDVYLDMASFF